MLLPREVAPFLLHEKFYVREHAVRYLCDAHDPSPVTADDFWKVIDQFGFKRAWLAVQNLHKLPQTEESYRRTIGALSGELSENSRRHLENVAVSFDIELLRRHRDEVLGFEGLPQEDRDHLRLRLEMANEPVGELWETLIAHAKEVNDSCASDFDERVSERLIEAIGRFADAGEKAAELLRMSDLGAWEEIFMVQVIGQARWEPGIDILLQKLELDGDVLSEEAFRALIRIGSADAVRKIEAFYPGRDWSVRLYLHEPLGAIKRPECEEALVRLIEQEKERDLAHNLAGSLCHLCPSPERLDWIRGLYAAGKLEGDMFDMPEDIMAAGTMVGYAPPEARNWDRKSNRDEERSDKIAAEFENFAKLMMADRGSARDALEAGDEDWMKPIRRTADKVGRNDPCPCGSGKKYKKCCLGKSSDAAGALQSQKR